MRRQDSQRYPVELWESVIDCCHDPAIRPRANYPLWRACALVCRDWRSRSQFNLLRVVAFSRAMQVDLLLQAITHKPSFADCIRGIAIDENPNGYIPFVNPLFRRLQACTLLDLAAVNWAIYPPKIVDLVALFSGITDFAVSFDNLTYSAAFRVIWAFRALRTLTITGVGKKPGGGNIAESLGALALRRKPNACSELRSLVINEPFLALVDGFPPRRAFGEAITCIQLHVPRRYGISEAMRRFLYSDLPQLDTLQVLISEGPRARGHGLGHVFAGLSSILPAAGNVFRGRVLRLSLPFNSSYGTTREEFLNILHEVLLGPAQAKPQFEGCFHCQHASARCETPLPCQRCLSFQLESTCIPWTRSQDWKFKETVEKAASRVLHLDGLYICLSEDYLKCDQQRWIKEGHPKYNHQWWNNEFNIRFSHLLSVTIDINFSASKLGNGSRGLWETAAVLQGSLGGGVNRDMEEDEELMKEGELMRKWREEENGYQEELKVTLAERSTDQKIWDRSQRAKKVRNNS